MNYQEFVNITVDECIKFADYLGYLPPEEFGEEEIIDSLESSNNQKAKEALIFYKNLSVTKADVLLEKVFNKLENGVEERTSTYIKEYETKLGLNKSEKSIEERLEAIERKLGILGCSV